MSIGVEVSVTWERGDLALWRNQGLEKAVANALSKAGRDAIRGMKSEGTRTVRTKKQIKVKRVTDSLPLSFARTKDIEEMEWRMDVSGALVPVSSLAHRQTRLGVTVAINTGRRSLIPSAFVATMKSGHYGVFLRKGKARLPIKEVFTTRVSDVFSDAGVIPSVLAKGLGFFDRTFDRVLPLEIDKLK